MIALTEDFSAFPMNEESKALLLEAISEFESDERNEVKRIIKERLLEIKRLEFMLEKAKADLARLAQENPTAIRMLAGK